MLKIKLNYVESFFCNPLYYYEYEDIQTFFDAIKQDFLNNKYECDYFCPFNKNCIGFMIDNKKVVIKVDYEEAERIATIIGDEEISQKILSAIKKVANSDSFKRLYENF